MWCPAVASIVVKKASAAVNGKRWFIDPDGNEVINSETKKWMQFLDRPNPVQDWSAFFQFAKTMNQVFGCAYIYVLRPVGMGTPAAMYVIPNWLVTPRYSGKLYKQSMVEEIIVGYQVMTNGQMMNVELQDMMVWRDNYYDFKNQYNQFWESASRLYSLKDPIANIIAAYEARNMLLTNTGAIGMISPDGKDPGGSVPLTDDQKKDIQNDYTTKYGLQRQKWAVLISRQSVKWTAMSRPTRDLLAFEEIEDSTRQIADNYGYPMFLLGFKSGTTFSNVEEAKKSLYQDTIIPEQQSFADCFNAYFGLERVQLAFDFSYLPVLQDDLQAEANAANTMASALRTLIESEIITVEQAREILQSQTNIIIP